MRGNPGNLRTAAAAKSAAARASAEDGLRQMRRRGDPITFRGLAQTAGFSELKMIIDIVLIRVVSRPRGGSR